MDATALLIARLIVGIGLTAHGMQKLLGCFGGYGLKGTASLFEKLGLRLGLLSTLADGSQAVARSPRTLPHAMCC